jgi:hypothetical protein
MFRFVLCASLALASAAGPAAACTKSFTSDKARSDYFAARTVQAHDVLVGRVMDVVSLPAPGNPNRTEGDATIAVLKVMKGASKPGDRLIVPVFKDAAAAQSGWDLPAKGGVYALYLAYDSRQEEHRVLDADPMNADFAP